MQSRFLKNDSIFEFSVPMRVFPTSKRIFHEIFLDKVVPGKWGRLGRDLLKGEGVMVRKREEDRLRKHLQVREG